MEDSEFFLKIDAMLSKTLKNQTLKEMQDELIVEITKNKENHKENFNPALVLERELMSRRMYKVDLKGVQDPSVLYGVAKRIRGAGNLGRGVSVSVLSNGNKKSGSLEIIGNLGSEDVRRILNPLSERKRFDYSVKARYC